MFTSPGSRSGRTLIGVNAHPHDNDPNSRQSDWPARSSGQPGQEQSEQGEHAYPSYTPRSGGYTQQHGEYEQAPQGGYDQGEDTGYPDLSAHQLQPGSAAVPGGPDFAPAGQSYQQPQGGYEQGGYEQGGHGYQQPGQQYDQQYDQHGYATQGYAQQSYAGQGYAQQSYGGQGYQQQDYQAQGGYPLEYDNPQYQGNYAETASTQPFGATTEPFGQGADPSSGEAPNQQPNSALQASMMQALTSKGFSPRLDNDGDLMFEASEQVLFVQCTENPFPAMRMFGQWRIDAAVSASQQNQLAACSTVGMDSHFVKVGIVDKVVIARVDHLVFPGTDLNVLLDISIAAIMGAITAWYQKVN